MKYTDILCQRKRDWFGYH